MLCFQNFNSTSPVGASFEALGDHFPISQCSISHAVLGKKKKKKKNQSWKPTHLEGSDLEKIVLKPTPPRPFLSEQKLPYESGIPTHLKTADR